MNNYKLRLGSYSEVSYFATGHLHDHYEIYVLFEGERIFFIDDKTYQLSAGDILLIKKNSLHFSAEKNDSDAIRGSIEFSDKMIQFFNHNHKINLLDCFYKDTPSFKLTSTQFEKFKHLFAVLKEEDNLDQVGRDTYIASILVQMLLLASRYQINSIQNKEINTSQRSFRVVNYINKNFEQDITLDQLAKMLHISSNHLCKVFKADTGYSVFQYLNIVRVKNAALILSTTNKKVTEVAFDCGFKNINHFTYIFKKQLGLTPSKYKKMNQ